MARKPLLVPVKLDGVSIAHSRPGYRDNATFAEIQAERDAIQARGGNPGWGPEGIMMVVEPFTTRLHFVGFRLDGKTYHSMWADEAGHTFPMFLADMEALVKSTALYDGAMHTEATFETCKKASSYGIRLAV